MLFKVCVSGDELYDLEREKTRLTVTEPRLHMSSLPPALQSSLGWQAELSAGSVWSCEPRGGVSFLVVAPGIKGGGDRVKREEDKFKTVYF